MLLNELADDGREDRDDRRADRRETADAQVVVVAVVLADVALPQVVAEDRVERRDVGGHAGHERGEQAGDRDAEQAVGQDVAHQQQQGVVVLDALAGGATGRRAAGLELADLLDEDGGDHARAR